MRKTADEGVTSSTTLQNDNNLVINVGANEVWEFETYLMVTAGSATPDFKMAFTVPSGATLRWSASFYTSAGSAYSGVITASASAIGFPTTGTVTETVLVKGIVANGATAGTLQFQFAQNTSNNQAITVKQNSYMKASKF